MNARKARAEEAATARAVLEKVRVADHWEPHDPAYLIDAAVRRWTSFDRRARPGRHTSEDQIKDLLRGLREAQGDDLLYEEPGWLEHVADRFGTALLAHATSSLPDPLA
jgi:hypothetical protein